MVGMQASLIERAADVYWAGAARMTIKADPDRAERSENRGSHHEVHRRACRRTSTSPRPRPVPTGRSPSCPSPQRAERHYTVISVDDHIVEPPDTFEGRVPRKFADRAPRVVDTDDGGQTWMYDGQSLPNVGFNAVVGRPVSEYGFEPARFDEMRRGAWDIHERVKDMDLNGVYASLNFPSFLPGLRRPAPAAGHQGPSTSRWRRCGPGTTGISRRGRAPIPSGSFRASCRGCSTPTSARR